MRKPALIALVIVLGLTLLLLGATFLFQWILPAEVYNFISLFCLVLVTVIGLMADIPEIIARFSGKKTTEFNQHQKLRFRRDMLQNVWNTWIEGMLKQSLFNEVLIELRVETNPDAVEHPWDLVVQMSDKEPGIVAAGTTILELFDQANGLLLILGEPGSGKTTMLLELCRQLINRANEDPLQTIPVVFNLSSWKSGPHKKPGQAFADWVVNELRARYSVPPKIGVHWVENDEILLLLDGLDELKEENREYCIQSINAFREEHSINLAVCSRRQEYQELAARLKLKNSVFIQPLNDQQVKDYFKALGRRFYSIHQSLVQRTVQMNCSQQEKDFLYTPLILSIMVLAYQNTSAIELKTMTISGDYRQRLFTDYVTGMFKRRGVEPHYPPEQTKKYLAWLANKMVKRRQSLFYLESIQPSWLQLSWTKMQLITGFFGGLIGGLGSGLFFLLISEVIGGQSGGLILYLLCGFSIGWKSGWDSTLNDYYPTEKLSWDWIGALYELIYGLILGFLFGLLFGLSIEAKGVLHFELIKGLSGGLFFGLFFGLLIGLGGGLRGSTIARRNKPGAGIRATIKNTLISGLISGLTCGLFVGVFVGRFISPNDWLSIGLNGSLSGVIVGLIFSLESGGFFLMGYYATLLLLHRGDCLPWSLTAFLNYCTNRIFLRRVGGNYIFIHRMLMEHFAGMYEQYFPSERK